MLSLRERLTFSLLGILPKSVEVEPKINSKKKHKKKNKKDKNKSIKSSLNVVEEEDEDDFVSISSDKIESAALDQGDPDNSFDDSLMNVQQFQPVNYQKQLIFKFENAQIGRLLIHTYYSLIFVLRCA